jgi:hypothetical protein
LVLQQVRLAEVGFCLVHAVGKHRLLAARQELLSLFFRQPKIACKLIYDVADPVLLFVARSSKVAALASRNLEWPFITAFQHATKVA